MFSLGTDPAATRSSAKAATLCLFFLTVFLAVGASAKNTVSLSERESLVFPVWEQMFDEHGFLTLDKAAPLDQARFSVSGLNRAEFLQENLSGGTITDMSALLPGESPGEDIIFNGPVSLDHDLGNAAVAFNSGQFGTEQVFATVERTATGKDTTIEVELFQYPVSLRAGEPWSLAAERLDGDIKAVVRFSDNVVTSVEIMRYDEGAFMTVEHLKGDSGGCGTGKTIAFCSGLEPFSVANELTEVWDDQYEPMQPINPHERIEIGIDTLAISPGLSFESLIIRTPEDLVLSRTALTLVDTATADELE